MLRYESSSSASSGAAWALYSEPARWHEWAPQLRGADGLGSPRVQAGCRGAARVVGGLRVPARILSVEDGRRWVWQVGPVRFEHWVEPRSSRGCTVGIDLHAPRPLEALLAVSYGPVCALLMANLARVAPSVPKGA